MTKKADTWMPFYVGDYLADTMLLTTLQHGAYLLLMLACWKAGGSLPDDDGALASASKLTPADWKRYAPALRRFFDARDGKLFHKRISHELERARNLSDKRTEAGKKGGRPAKQNQKETNRFPDGSAKAKQNETPSPSPKPTTSDADASAGKPAAPPTPKDVVFALGVPLLTASGVKEPNARSFLAMQVKAHGDAKTAEALQACAEERPVEPISWLQARLGPIKTGAKAGKHAGFDQLDYHDGVTADGHLA